MNEPSAISLFPRKIDRINYLLRSILTIFLTVGAGFAIWFLYFQNPDRMMESILPIILVFFGACFWRLFFMDAPRMRSAGLSPWLILLILIPGVVVVIQILLLVLPPADGPRKPAVPPRS